MSNLPIVQTNSDISTKLNGSVTVTYTEWTEGFTQLTDKENEQINKRFEDGLKLEILCEAKEISRSGLSVFSTKVDKTPVIKRTNRIVELRSNPLTNAEIEIDFGHPNVAGIAINCGPVPGQEKDLECLDIDCPKLSTHFLDDLKDSNAQLQEKLLGCVEETPSEGLHIFYYLPLGKSRCRDLASMNSESAKAWLAESKARGSTKATAPPLIETRGAGGYVVGFLSKAVSKIDGMVKHYKMLHGSVETIPMLTAEEHDFLMAFAQSYDEKSIKKFATANPEPFYKYETDKKNALEQWRAEMSWPEILPESYRVVEVNPDYFLVWHPDSSGKEPNAIAGSKSGGKDRYWNFSPLDWRLPANTPLTKDWVYTQSRGIKKGSLEYKKFYSGIFAKYLNQNSCTKAYVDLSDDVNLNYWETVNKITPNNPENLISLLGQDLIDVCDDFETPIISRVFAVSILSHVFGWFWAERLSDGTKWHSITQQIILAHSCAGKNRPRRYMISLLKMLQERISDWIKQQEELAITKNVLANDLPPDREYPTFDGTVSDFGKGSVEGFLEKLVEIRVRLAYIEEIVDFFESRNTKAVAEEQLTLLKTYSSAQDYVPARDLTTNGKTPEQIKDQKKTIINPIVNFIGFGQPERITQPSILCEKDFSGGTISRLFIFTEGDKTTRRKDGSVNMPKRRGGLPSPQVVDAIFNRVVDLIQHGGVTEIPESIWKHLDDLHLERWHRIHELEQSKTYVPSIHGRGPEKAYSIAFLHSICEPEGWREIKKTDIDFAFRYHEAGNIDVKKLHDLTIGSPLKKYIDEFMKNAMKLAGEELTVSTVVARWKFRGVNKYKKSVGWVKETLVPELIKLELIKIVNEDTGFFEVQKNG